MFFCEDCRVKQGWPKSLRGSEDSNGRCEVCGNSRPCYDVQSSRLPGRLHVAKGVALITPAVEIDMRRSNRNGLNHPMAAKTPKPQPGDISDVVSVRIVARCTTAQYATCNDSNCPTCKGKGKYKVDLDMSTLVSMIRSEIIR